MSEAYTADPTKTPRMPSWGEKEIGRFSYRVGLFTRRGMARPQAEDLADRLYERDFERDDRRACVECSGFKAESPMCRNRQPAMPCDLLHRCNRFDWMKPQ